MTARERVHALQRLWLRLEILQDLENDMREEASALGIPWLAGEIHIHDKVEDAIVRAKAAAFEESEGGKV